MFISQETDSNDFPYALAMGAQEFDIIREALLAQWDHSNTNIQMRIHGMVHDMNGTRERKG